jgi:hypothetical protein
MRVPVSCGLSGSSVMVVEFGLPELQSRRRSRNSGLAMQMTSMGESVIRSTSCSITPTTAGSAHCRSSTTTISGAAFASASR